MTQGQKRMGQEVLVAGASVAAQQIASAYETVRATAYHLGDASSAAPFVVAAGFVAAAAIADVVAAAYAALAAPFGTETD